MPTAANAAWTAARRNTHNEKTRTHMSRGGRRQLSNQTTAKGSIRRPKQNTIDFSGGGHRKWVKGPTTMHTRGFRLSLACFFDVYMLVIATFLDILIHITIVPS